MGNFINELNNYQQIPRSLIFDTTLSDRARFVFVYMASKPNTWDFYMASMSKELGYSQETLRKYISELIQGGWLTRHKQSMLSSGVFGSVSYTLHSEKKNQESTDTKFDRSGKIPTRKNTDTEKVLHIEIQDSIEIDNKEKINNNIMSNSEKQAADDDLKAKADELYKLYPSKCPKRNVSLGKSLKDKVKLIKLMKSKDTPYEMLKFTIQSELDEKYGKQYMSNFSTFLNNLPDYDYAENLATKTETHEIKATNGKRYR